MHGRRRTDRAQDRSAGCGKSGGNAALTRRQSIYESSWKRSHKGKNMTLEMVRPRQQAPTLSEVAHLAGVSIATASRVLNNSAPVSMQARQQVRDAVVRLGYVRHRAAPSTPRGRARTVAAVVCANYGRFFADGFFAQVIAAATEVFAARDVPLMLLVAPDERVAPVERYLHGGHVDGVLLLASHGQHPLAVSLPAAGMPVTLV